MTTPDLRYQTVHIQKVTKSFGRTYGVNKASCSLKKGQLTILLGPNGAGKSTLLSMLATLTEPTSGSITYGQYEPSEWLEEIRGTIGFAGHSSMLYPNLSGEENLKFFAQLYRLENPEERIKNLLETVGMSTYKRRMVGQCSRGMIQRISIARALLHQPRLLLMDEPFSGLDRKACEELIALLSKQKQQGKILCLVTHDLSLPSTEIDQVLILREGQLVYSGNIPDQMKLQDLYTRVLDRIAAAP